MYCPTSSDKKVFAIVVGRQLSELISARLNLLIRNADNCTILIFNVLRRVYHFLYLMDIILYLKLTLKINLFQKINKL